MLTTRSLCHCGICQVSGKDLRRFVHVLNTWESSKLFAPQQIAQMRAAANRALAVVDPSAMAQPVSFSQEPPPQSRLRPGQPAGAVSSTHQQQDMELRSLLTKVFTVIMRHAKFVTDIMCCAVLLLYVVCAR